MIDAPSQDQMIEAKPGKGKRRVRKNARGLCHENHKAIKTEVGKQFIIKE